MLRYDTLHDRLGYLGIFNQLETREGIFLAGHKVGRECPV